MNMDVDSELSPSPLEGHTVLILGGGELGKEIAIAFAELGVGVQTVDRYAGAPAAQVCAINHVVDLNDEEALGTLLREVAPTIVVPENDDFSHEALKAYAEESGTRVAPSINALDVAHDRESFLKVATEELGLPTPRFLAATSLQELRSVVEELGMPCVLKSLYSSSGRGQSLIRTEADIDIAWERRKGERVVVESFVDFDDEISVVVARSFDPKTGKLATWFSEPIGHAHERGELREMWQPATVPSATMDNARSVAARITNHIGGQGVFVVELFVAGDDVYFAGVAPRPHASGLVTLATQRFNQFQMHARAILGLPIDATLISPGAAITLLAQDESPEVTISGVADALAVPETDLRIFAKPSTFEGRRMGIIFSTAETVGEARDQAVIAASQIRIN